MVGFLKNEVRSRWHLLIMPALLGLVAAYLIGPPADRAPDVSYEASHTLLWTTRDERSVDVIAFLAGVGAVPTRAAEALGDDTTARDLASQVQIIPAGDVSSLVIRTTQDTPERAVEVADGYAAALQDFLTESAAEETDAQVAALNLRLESLNEEISRLDRSMATLSVREGSAGELAVLDSSRQAALDRRASVTVLLDDLLGRAGSEQLLVSIAFAEPEEIVIGGFESPIGRNAFAMLGLFVGIALGIAGIFLFDQVRPRLRHTADFESAYEVPVVAVMPRDRWGQRGVGLAVIDRPDSGVGLAYRRLQKAVRAWMAPDTAPQREAGPAAPTLLIASAVANEGGSSVMANLAVTLARLGQHVLVVPSADSTGGMAGHIFSIDGPIPPSLASAEGTPEDRRSSEYPHSARREIPELKPTSIPRLFVLDDPIPHGASQAEMRGAIGALDDVGSGFDLVLIDGPALLAPGDAFAFTGRVDGLLLVGKAGTQSPAQAALAREVADALDVPLVGVVINGVSRSEKIPRQPDFLRTRPRLVTGSQPGGGTGAGSESAGADGLAPVPGAVVTSAANGRSGV